MDSPEGAYIDLIVAALANDYEPLGVLAEDVQKAARKAGIKFSEHTFRCSINKCVERGLIEPIIYNQASSQYEEHRLAPSELDEKSRHELLFRLTDRGEQRLNELGY